MNRVESFDGVNGDCDNDIDLSLMWYRRLCRFGRSMDFRTHVGDTRQLIRAPENYISLNMGFRLYDTTMVQPTNIELF